MGYGTSTSWDVCLKKELNVEEIRKKIEEWKKNTKDADKDWHYWDDLELADDGEFTLNEYYMNGLGGERLKLLCDFIAPLVMKDCEIEMQGDDSHDLSRVTFDGEGGWVFEDGFVCYNILQSFKDKYYGEMPDSLKNDIEKWLVGRKV